jgi:peptidoglycan/xylan/chitin deacetylase (PgdA/CDA1 family)
MSNNQFVRNGTLILLIGTLAIWSQNAEGQEAFQQKKLLPIPDRLVVLSFDDGNKSDITNVAGVLKKHGFGATFYVTEGLGFTRDKKHFLTWDEVKKLDADGFEIGNHTRSHPNVTRLSKERLRAEIQHIQQRCEEHDISTPTTFCFPGWSHNRQAVDVIAEFGFQFARRGVGPEFKDGGKGGRGPSYDPLEDHPLLIPTTGYAGPDWSLEDLQWAVEQAKDGKIAVITFHGVPGPLHPWVSASREQFDKYMNYLAEKKCKVIAVRALAKYVDPTKRPEDPYAPIRRRQVANKVQPK